MAIALTGTGGLFSRLGLLMGWARNRLGILGNTAPSPGSAWGSGGPTIDALGASANLIQAQYASTLQGVIGNLYTGSLTTARSTPSDVNDMVTYATNTLIQMANNDTPLASLTLNNAMALLVSQMLTNSNTVTRNVPSITATAFGGTPANTGNFNWAVSVINNAGKKVEYALAETLVATVTGDANNNATAGTEPVTIAGTAADTGGTLDWAWPLGSGSTTTTNIIDPTLNAQQNANLLTNSSWATWTGAVPNNWHITVNAGAVSKDVSNTYGKAVASLAFTSTGAEVPSLYQQFTGTGAVSPDTTTSLLPLTSYLGSMIIKLSASTVGGAVAVDLTDGAGTVVNDQNSVANTAITTLTNQTTNTLVTFNFRTPEITPATGYRLRIRISTALDTGKSLYVNYLAFAKATQLYTQGPFANVFRGSVDPIIGDSTNIAVTNALAGVFQTMFLRFFPSAMAIYGPLPSAASGTINDNLVLA